MNSPRVFDTVSIIFNLNSTGDASKLASELHEQLGNLRSQGTGIRLHRRSMPGTLFLSAGLVDRRHLIFHLR
ncbi:hypothetical protein IWX65_002051 [Arthrobacter sp. CAN_A214]